MDTIVYILSGFNSTSKFLGAWEIFEQATVVTNSKIVPFS